MSLSVSTSNTIKTFFANKVGKCARKLNQIAINELRHDKIEYTFPKATTEDLKRLTSKKIEDSYKRVSWINPKDGKVYHILEEGRTKDSVNVRILAADGEFIKNATLKPKTVVIFDQFKNLSGLRNMIKLKFNKAPGHGEIVETYLRRANPFVNVERLEHKKNLFEMLKHRGDLPQSLMNKRFNQLSNKMNNGHNVDYISISEANDISIGKYSKSNGVFQKEIIKEHGLVEIYQPLINAFQAILAKGCRIFVSSGNSGAVTINRTLAIDGVEGVGALAKSGQVAKSSGSRNSIFTQHYEQWGFKGKVVEEDGKILGINITGQPGAELPYNKKYKHLIRPICGTSYSTPIRVGKIALNDMMEGII